MNLLSNSFYFIPKPRALLESLKVNKQKIMATAEHFQFSTPIKVCVFVAIISKWCNSSKNSRILHPSKQTERNKNLGSKDQNINVPNKANQQLIKKQESLTP